MVFFVKRVGQEKPRREWPRRGLEAEIGNFAILQVKILEEVAGTGMVSAEQSVNRGGDAAVRKD